METLPRSKLAGWSPLTMLNPGVSILTPAMHSLFWGGGGVNKMHQGGGGHQDFEKCGWRGVFSSLSYDNQINLRVFP